MDSSSQILGGSSQQPQQQQPSALPRLNSQSSSVFAANYVAPTVSKHKVEVAVVYHASLSLPHLIGSFDAQGRWVDGLLLRKIRYWHDRNIQQSSSKHQTQVVESNATKGKSKSNKSGQNKKNDGNKEDGSGENEAAKSSDAPLNLLILTGPINAHIEQLFHAILCQGLRSTYTTHEKYYPVLAFPTGEMFPVAPHTKIILETTDLSDVSPACLSLLPIQVLAASPDIMLRRMLQVWLRSLVHWLGDFAPWLDFLDDLQTLLLRTKFVEDLLYDEFGNNSGDANSRRKPVTAIVLSKVSTFLRLLEELLLQCQELCLPHATFTIPEERSDSESDSEQRGNRVSILA